MASSTKSLTKANNKAALLRGVDATLGVEVAQASNCGHGGSNPGINEAFSHADLANRNERRTRSGTGW